MNRISPKSARFDARLSPEQKAMFEKAASLQGYKTLSDFVIQVVQEAAAGIIDRHQTILASERDRQVFFNALANPPKPSKRLIKAARDYKKMISQK